MGLCMSLLYAICYLLDTPREMYRSEGEDRGKCSIDRT